MNTTATTCRLSAIALAASLFAAASLPAQAASGAQHGGYDIKANKKLVDQPVDRNWFNPANWSDGRVPGPGDSVQLDGNDYVVIDPAQSRGGMSTGKVVFDDLHVRDGATLEVIGGAIVQTRTQVQADRGRIIFRGSVDLGDTLIAGAMSDPRPTPDGSQECTLDATGMKVCTVPGDGGSGGGVFLNPSPQNKRTIVLQSGATLDVGLGGTEPAAFPDVTGDGREDVIVVGLGHHATMTVDTLVIDGDLKLSTYYGFTPRPGQSFPIITVNGLRTGQFLGLPEGGYVACSDTSTCLRISYRGGDGNDVVLTADSVRPEIALLLPAVQKVREAASRRSAAAPAITDLGVAPPSTAIGLLLPAVQKVREAAAR